MLSLAIVTFNSELSIGNALRSLDCYMPSNMAPRMIIVDNASMDDTAAIVENFSRTNPNISFIRNTKNVGFGQAHNQALAISESRYHIICNPDIIVSSDVFSPLAALLDRYPDIAIACPQFRYTNGELQPLNRHHPTVIDLLLRRLPTKVTGPLFKRRLEHYDMRDIGYERSYDVPFVSGAFMFCRTRVLKEIQGFDERFFLYFEDADLSRRVQNHGYRSVYCPNASVTHVWARLAHKSPSGSWIFVQSAYKYFRKWGFRWA
jgi:GT2 family glycosyltransferase